MPLDWWRSFSPPQQQASSANAQATEQASTSSEQHAAYVPDYVKYKPADTPMDRLKELVYKK